MTLRIGIDGRPLMGKLTGVGRYVFELCKEIDNKLPDAKFFVYSPKPIEMPVESERWIARIDQSSLTKFMKPVIWLKTRLPYLCKKDNLDVFWGGATFLPPLGNVRRITTIHDINFKLVPETMGFTHLWANKIFFNNDVQRADILLVNSKGTAKRVHFLTGREADAIIYPSVSSSFYPQSNSIVQQYLDAYRLHQPYILCVATWEPRKNLEMLVHTFISMKKEGLLPHKLVLVGGKGWNDQHLTKIMTGKDRDEIFPLGYVPDEHLPSLYSGADVFVFPSMYEGFGMPLLEARACGTRVVASDVPELREAGGENAIYVDPTKIGIRNGILLALLKENDRNDFEVKIPSWGDGAEILAKSIIGEL